jgi:hypothetical protein
MTTQPASLSFRLYQGATFSEPVTLNDGSGNPINLTGCTAKLQARRDIADTDPVFALDSTTGGIVLGGAAGTITLNLSAAATKALAIDWDGEMWLHDLLLSFPDATVQRTYQGAIYAYPAVTR